VCGWQAASLRTACKLWPASAQRMQPAYQLSWPVWPSAGWPLVAWPAGAGSLQRYLISWPACSQLAALAGWLAFSISISAISFSSQLSLSVALARQQSAFSQRNAGANGVAQLQCNIFMAYIQLSIWLASQRKQLALSES